MPARVLYDPAVQKLLDEVGLSILDAANKGEWHNLNITRPEALAAQARAASGFSESAQVAAKRPSQGAVTKGAASSTSRAAASGASVTASATCKPESRRNLKPTKPAIEISDADRKRKILITDKCTMALNLKKWREKGESFRVVWIGTGALKVAVYIKSCPQKPRLRKRRPRSSRKRTISVTVT
jgi:hypothetical protein